MTTLRMSLAGTLILTLLASTAAIVSAQVDDTTFSDPVSGGLVYGDPDGRFTLPLVGDWTTVETDGSHPRFRLADPAVDLYIVSLPADEVAGGAEAALAEIGIDTQELTLVEEGTSGDFPGWGVQVYASDDGQLVGALTRDVDGAAVTLVGVGDPTKLLSAETILTIHGFTDLPVAEYLARVERRATATAPTTVAAITDLDSVEFYSGGTKLVGRLLLPDGEGPFPAIVGTHGSEPTSRFSTASHYVPTALVDAGFAVFYHDKRGVDDSEGVLVGVGPESSGWRLPQLADDALAAVAFVAGLDEIDADRIGLMGGSQAGWVNPLAASRSDDLAFVVSVSGPTVSVGEEIHFSDLTGGDRLPEMTAEELEGLSEQFTAFDGAPGFDPRPAIEAMTTPALWVWGERDGSIPVPESRAILEDVMAQHDKDFTILSYHDQDHGFVGHVYLDDAIEWINTQLER